MALSSRLLSEITQNLSDSLHAASSGHCLRVDHLSREDAIAICKGMRAADTGSDINTFVLDLRVGDDEVTIRPERAIEIRNRKDNKLCLLIPAGVTDATTSSLTNSFAAFDLDACLEQIGRDLVESLPTETKKLVRLVLATVRGMAGGSAERRAAYVAAVADDPTANVVGRELWRIGLVPDLGSDLAQRLDLNRQCIRLLIHPARSQTSPVERLNELKLKPGALKDEVGIFLKGRRLGDGAWLEEISRSPYRERLTFERWSFEAATISNLESIVVSPLTSREGKVEAHTKLSQPGGVGTQPVASVGPKSRVGVKWNALPAKPANLHKWRLEIIPSREEYRDEDIAGVELPSSTIGATRRSGSIVMDLDLDALPIRAVQFRVIALDELGAELRGVNGDQIEGLSTEFWLDEGTDTVAPIANRRRAVPNLPFGRIRAALEINADSFEESTGQWSEHDLDYFSVTLNGHYTNRIGMSSVLRSIETQTIENPDRPGAYSATVDIAERLDVEKDVVPVELSLESTEAGRTFLGRRKEVFRLLRRQEHRGLIETCEWNQDLSRRVRAYASAYRDLLRTESPLGQRRAALSVDTFVLNIRYSHGVESAVVILPTHPLRLLWFAAYTDLLSIWEKELLGSAAAGANSLDPDLLERVTPLNCPAFVMGMDDVVFLFAQNLRFFWGLALPVGVQDPARRAADCATVLGLNEDEATVSGVSPSRVATELRSYQTLHPYISSMRLNVINPGTGIFVAETLRALLSAGSSEDEREGTDALLRVDLVTHAYAPTPARLPAVSTLQKEVYDLQPRGRKHHLAPLFAAAIRPIELLSEAPDGDAHVSVAIDYLSSQVAVVPEEANEDSASFYGLLVRFVPQFSAASGTSTWRHQLAFPEHAGRVKHPGFGPYTNEILDSHRDYLETVAAFLPGDGLGMPSVVAALTPEERGAVDELHRRSDWVITLDRFFGVEFYDDPGDVELSRVARKYLLDYSPEFLDGLGHRMLVTTSHREEVEEVLSRAMTELGFGLVEESVGEVLDHLKTISGRLALRIIGDDAHAREAVSLGVVAAYLRAHGELEDSILIPVDAHPELFAPSSRPRKQGTPRARCDLIRIRFQRNRLVATFIEVKSRAAAGESDELMNRIADQIEATEDVFRNLFFRDSPGRLDHVLQRARLATILRFYLRRAHRYGLVRSKDNYAELESSIRRLEAGLPDLIVDRRGFVVNLHGKKRAPLRLRDVNVEFLTARDLTDIGMVFRDEIVIDEDTPSPARGRGKPKPSGSVVTPTEQTPDRDDIVVDEAPATGERQVEIQLGIASASGDSVTWRPSTKGSPHMFILGIPGQGKSWTISRVISQLGRQNIPAVVLDFHGQFGEQSIGHDGLVLPPIVDASQGLPFSPFEAARDQEAGARYWKTNAFAVAEIFQYVCDLGDVQRDVVYEAVRDAYLAVDFERSGIFPTIAAVQSQLEAKASLRGARNVISRCRPLLEFGLFADGPSQNPFDPMRTGGIVVDLHNLGLEALQIAGAAFLLRKLYKDMFSWGESDHLRLAVILDEAHRLASDTTLPRIMKEGRKFGVSVIAASQGLADYHPEVVGNAGAKVVFRTNFPMSKKVAGYLKPAKSLDLSAELERLSVGVAYVQTEGMNECVQVNMHSVEAPRSS